MKNTTATTARWLGAALATTLCLAALPARASCSDAPMVFVTSVSRTFSGGSAWSFDVYRKQCEGLVIQAATFKAADGDPRVVLAQANIAEIQVPTLTGSPRNLDVTSNSEGLGDTNTAGTSFVATLGATECEGGTLFDQNRICVANEDGEYRWRGGGTEANHAFRLGERVVVLMSSQVGKENYINRWEFNDDGVIDVSLGVTGAVPFTKSATSYASYGSRLDNSSNTPPRIGLAHLHNVYYRLDFDLDGAADDVVSRRTFAPTTTGPPDSGHHCSTTGECGKVTISPITTETSQSWSSSAQTTWFITDKVIENNEARPIGYEIVPEIQGIWRGMTGGSEPWAGSELWVTKYNACELFALKNAAPALPASCGTGNKTHVQAMTNSESLVGQDIVVWYANRMLHDPRDEDESNMAVRWMRFEIVPHNFHHRYPVEPPPPTCEVNTDCPDGFLCDGRFCERL
jgi:primary-amine oxidase